MSAAAPSLTPDALPAVTVPSGRTIGFSLPSASSVVARGCSSLSTIDRVALALRDFDRDDLGGETAVGLRGGGLLLAAQRERVLVLAADLEVLRDILAGARHGVVAIGGLHLRIDEAPADGGVVHLGVAVEGAASPWP